MITTIWHKANRPVVGKSWYLFGTRHRYYGPAYSPTDNQLRLGFNDRWVIHGIDIK